MAQKLCRRFWFLLFFLELEANEATGGIFLRTSKFNLVSFAAVFWDVTQRSPQRNGCSYPNNIPFHCLANHSFRSIFENLVAPNSPFETCPIRYHFLSSHHMVGNSYINNADNGDNCDSWRSLPSRVSQVQYCGPKCLLENCQREGRYLRYCAIRYFVENLSSLNYKGT